jgi:hypothetical protein
MVMVKPILFGVPTPNIGMSSCTSCLCAFVFSLYKCVKACYSGKEFMIGSPLRGLEDGGPPNPGLHPGLD